MSINSINLNQCNHNIIDGNYCKKCGAISFDLVNK